MTKKNAKPIRSSNRQWLQTNLPAIPKRDHSELKRDPCSLLFDDAWMLTDCSLREPRTSTKPDALSWPCALAWLCAREQEFVEAFDRTCRQQRLDLSAASAHLIDHLAQRFRQPRSAANEAVALADEQLSSLLCSGVIEAKGRPANGGQHTKIDRTAWLYFDSIGDAPHDAFFDWGKKVVTFVDVRITGAALLRRWAERPAARLIGIIRPTWNLPETLHWYARGTHVGYEDKVALTREESADACDRLGQDLRTGALRARASLRANVPGAKESHLGIADRDTSFWQTFSLSEIAIAEVFANDVRSKVPGGIRLDGFKSWEPAVKYLMTEHGMRQASARALARVRVPKGTSGPQRRSR